MSLDQGKITSILREATTGSKDAYDTLLPLVYDKLLNIAQNRIQQEGNHTYSRTDLVHEAYFNLINVDEITWQDRNHFFCMASRCMRRVLIDHARKKKAAKRGGNQEKVACLDDMIQVERQADDLIELDEALHRLSKLNERMVKVVECRYFGEMSVKETADALDVSPRTIIRDWSKARGWLYNELEYDVD